MGIKLKARDKKYGETSKIKNGTEMQRSINWLGTFSVLVLFWVSPTHANTHQKLTLYFNERTPYLESKENERVEGLTASPANHALTLANIPYAWKRATAEQQIAVIDRNQEHACLVGWFKRPERERVGKYTAPLYMGKQMVALALASNSRVQAKMRVADLMKDDQLTMLVKDGYSYGQILDQQIRNFSPRIIIATGENTNMLNMLVYKRADYFLVSEEEANALIQRSDHAASDFKLTYFAEAIKEDPRYFWCTKQVPDTLIMKLNRVLEKMVATAHHRRLGAPTSN